MTFDPPNAVSKINQAVAAADDEGDGWDVIGEPLTPAIDDVVPAYDRVLELKLSPRSGDKRLEICGLNWGRIGKDVARLNGLAAALTEISRVVKQGNATIAQDWKGEAYDAFRVQVEKVTRLLDDYSTAVQTTAAGLQTVLDNIRSAYGTYRDDTLDTHLKFDGLTKPADWHKVNDEDFERFVLGCEAQEMHTLGCLKNNDEQKSYLINKIVTKQNYADAMRWQCQSDAGLVISQYSQIAEWADEERSAVSGKIHNWYKATDQLKSTVRSLFEAALDNLRVLAETKPFASMSVPGAAGGGPGTGGGDTGTGGGDTGGGDTGGGVSTGGFPSGGAADAELPVQEPVETAEAPVQEPVQTPAPAEEVPTSTVEIRDGDRTIAVTGAAGQDHVKVTVTDAEGHTSTYDLDFTTVGGTPAPAAATGDPSTPHHVAAGTDGRCVIQNGDVTITAERSLFDADTLTLTVDGPTTEPTTYAVDFTAEDSGSPAQPTGPAQPQSDLPADARPGGATTSDGEDRPDPGAARPSAGGDASGGSPAGVRPGVGAVEVDGPQGGVRPSVGGDGSEPGGSPAGARPGVGAVEVDGPQDGARPSVAGDGSESGGLPTGSRPGGAGSPEVDGRSGGAGDIPADARPDADDRPESGDAQPGARPAGAGPADRPESGGADGDRRPEAGARPGAADDEGRFSGSSSTRDGVSSDPSAGDRSGEHHVPAMRNGDAPPAGGTAPSQFAGGVDPSGTLSGVLVPERPDGEAGLSSAGEPGGAAGAGMPLMAGAGAGSGVEGLTGRAGSGWSVHGDLFDTGDPVHSMHGVLGEDDLNSR